MKAHVLIPSFLSRRLPADMGSRAAMLVVLCSSVPVAMASCSAPGSDFGSGGGGESAAPPEQVEASPAARDALTALRTRFVLAPSGHDDLRLADARRSPREANPAIGAGVAEGFRGTEDGLVPVVPSIHPRATARPAKVTLPNRASGGAHLEDVTSHVAVTFALRGAGDAAGEVAGGLVLYPRGGPEGATVVHRPHAEGTEDYVVFEARPLREELVYDIDVSGVPGLRLVGGTLELMDEEGTPRLRVAPPYVVDSAGEVHAAELSVEGCAFDTDPRAPWGRPVTSPEAKACAVKVSWSGVGYPLLVDPSWVTTGAMVSKRWNHLLSLLGTGQVLVAGGADDTGAAPKVTELYDPTSGTWSATGSMSVGRYFHSQTLLANGKVLVAAGRNANGVLASSQLYNPITGTWSATDAMSTARNAHAAVLLGNGKVLAAGGSNSSGTGLKSSELYDPSTATWSNAGAMPSSYTPNAVLMGNGSVLIAGGTPTASTAAAVYDPSAGTWSKTGPMNVARGARYFMTALGNGKVLVAGGTNSSGTAMKAAEVYDPSVGTWSTTGAMTTARGLPIIQLLGSGKVLVAGGHNNSGTVASSELYDPGSGTWKNAGAMNTQRQTFAASLLPDGTVLVSGGYNGSAIVRSAEIYGLCVGVVCTAQDQCHTAGTCDPTTGQCDNPSKADGSACDDGNASTVSDVCTGGTCTGTNLCAGVVCTAQDECHLAGTCDPATGACDNPPNPTCTTPICVTIQRGLSGAVADALINSGTGTNGSPTMNYGGSNSLSATVDATGQRQGLLSFDLSGIPDTALIVSAVATLDVLLYGGAPVYAHRVIAPWSESTVTWLSFGGAYLPAVEATFPGTFAPGTASADLTVLAQGWVDGSFENDGILLERGVTGMTVFASSEYLQASRPRLDVCYLP